MAKTLIIKDVSFSTNKLTTVTFPSIPCTGVSFSTDTYTLTGYGQQEIEYTLTPSDTTDEVTWASSNADIITVADGVMTVVGVGTCTVTATCGEYSATATITVTMQASLDWVLRLPSINSDAHVLYYTSENGARATAYGSGDCAGEYKIADALNSGNSVPVIKLPGNTGRIKISITSSTELYNSAESRVYWLKDESAGWSGDAYAAYMVSAEDTYNITTETEKTYTVPDEINAISFSTRFSSAQSSLADAKAKLEAAGLKIEFLPPAE